MYATRLRRFWIQILCYFRRLNKFLWLKHIRLFTCRPWRTGGNGRLSKAGGWEVSNKTGNNCHKETTRPAIKGVILSDPLTHVWFRWMDVMCLRWIWRPPKQCSTVLAKRAFRESSDDLLKNAPVSHNKSHQSYLFQIFSSFSHQISLSTNCVFILARKVTVWSFLKRVFWFYDRLRLSSDSFNCISVSFLLVIHSHYCWSFLAFAYVTEPRYFVLFLNSPIKIVIRSWIYEDSIELLFEVFIVYSKMYWNVKWNVCSGMWNILNIIRKQKKTSFLVWNGFIFPKKKLKIPNQGKER